MKRKTDHIGLLCLLAFVLLVLLALSGRARSSEIDIVDRIDAAILHVVYRGIPAHNIAPWPGNPLAKEPAKRREFSEAVVFAGVEKNVDPFLLTAVGFREGSFGGGKAGKLGEITVFQIMPRTLKFAKTLDARCSEDTYRGSAICAASLLNYWERQCGSIRGAAVKYATGRTCKADTEKLAWLVWDRFGIAKELKRATEE